MATDHCTQAPSGSAGRGFVVFARAEAIALADIALLAADGLPRAGSFAGAKPNQHIANHHSVLPPGAFAPEMLFGLTGGYPQQLAPGQRTGSLQQPPQHLT
jgi:hypothetical protein